MKDQILLLQSLQNQEEFKTILVEILALMAVKIEELEGKLLATRESVDILASGGKLVRKDSSDGFSIG
jgi:hypothetical protein